MLPTDAELSAAVGDTVTSTGSPTTGGPDVLQAIAATPSDCVGVTAPLTQTAFATAPVREVAFRVTSRGLVGALTLGSPWQAQSLFKGFAVRWKQCLGKIALYRGGGPVYAITTVDATDTMLSAAVIGSGRVSQPGLALDQRALAVISNCIVDVQIAHPWRRAGSPPSANQAVEVAHLILSKAIGLR
jgi:PknH-like extracellular domain